MPVFATLDSNVVSASYFDAVGWKLVEGDMFADRPLPGDCRVAVINEQAAQRYFEGSPIGAAAIDAVGRRTTIVGVVRAAPLRTLQNRIEPAIYFPVSQDFLPVMTAILATVLERMSGGPARALGLPVPRIAVGEPANLVLLDLDAEWTVREDGFRSRSANSWLLGRTLAGAVVKTVAAGRVVFAA